MRRKIRPRLPISLFPMFILLVGSLVLLSNHSRTFIRNDLPVVIDHTDYKKIRYESEPTTAYYPVIKFGYDIDSLILEESTPRFESYYPDHDISPFGQREMAQLSIWVDTTQNLVAANLGHRMLFEGYPVTVINESNNVSSIGTEHTLSFILEAVDSNGNWRAIEKHFYWMCGTGLSGIMLSPHEMDITSVAIYQGEFKTKMRLKFYDNYSNEFIGHVNHRQFVKE